MFLLSQLPTCPTCFSSNSFLHTPPPDQTKGKKKTKKKRSTPTSLCFIIVTWASFKKKKIKTPASLEIYTLHKLKFLLSLYLKKFDGTIQALRNFLMT